MIPNRQADGSSDERTGASSDRVALEIQDVGKQFPGGSVALDDVSLEVREGEFLTLLGPSGSGKTTLLRIIAGFESPTRGRLELDGRDIAELSPGERNIGMVFQNYALFPHLSVSDNIAYGLRMHKWPRRERTERIEEMLELVQLGDYGARMPSQLSGGQRQRVAIARALAYRPSLLLMDEPLGALDRTLRLEMEAQIQRIHRMLGVTVVYVTHDQHEALALSDRVAIMNGGRVAAIGTPYDLFQHPGSSFVAGFFSAFNLVQIPDPRIVGDGSVRVEALGRELELGSAPVPAGGPLVLAVPPRSVSLEPTEDGVRLETVVVQKLLLGFETELKLQCTDGTVLACVLPTKALSEVSLDDRLPVHVDRSAMLLLPAR